MRTVPFLVHPDSTQLSGQPDGLFVSFQVDWHILEPEPYISRICDGKLAEVAFTPEEYTVFKHTVEEQGALLHDGEDDELHYKPLGITQEAFKAHQAEGGKAAGAVETKGTGGKTETKTSH